MDLDIFNTIRKEKPDIKAISIMRYQANINNLFKKMGVEPSFDALLNADKVLDAIDELSESSIKMYMNSLIVYLKAKGYEGEALDKYCELRDKLNGQYFEEKSSNKKNDKEEKNMVSEKEWDGLIEKLESKIKKYIGKNQQLGKDQYNTILEHLLFSIYRKYPLRNDLSLMKVTNKTRYKKDSDPEYNYLILGKDSKFILNEYKTAGTYGQNVIDLDKETADLIKRYLRNSKNKEYFITDYQGIPMTKPRISKFIIDASKKHLGKNAGIMMMRKSAVSEKFGDVLKEQKELAKVMGHDVNTQKAVYTKTD